MLWGIKRGGFALDYRITVEKVLTWGQAQAKPFHNQWGNQTGPRRGRNKWAQSGGGESGSPGKQRQGGGRVALLAAELGPGQQRSQAGSLGPRSGLRQRQDAFKGIYLREMSALAKSGGLLACCSLAFESKESGAGLSPRSRGFINTAQHTLAAINK